MSGEAPEIGTRWRKDGLEAVGVDTASIGLADNDELWNVVNEVAKFLLGSLQFLNISTRSIPSDDVAMLIANRFGTNREPPKFSVEPPHASFRLARLSRKQNGSQLLQHASLFVWVKCALPSLTESLCPSKPCVIEPSFIGKF